MQDVPLSRCYRPWRSSTLRIWANKPLSAIFAVEAAPTGTRPAFALRVCALIVARAALRTPLAKFPSQKLANGKEPAECTPLCAIATRTGVPRSVELITESGLNRGGYTPPRNACLTRAIAVIVVCYKVLSTS